MRRLLAVALATLPLISHAWHAEGHQTVATIAARLIEGTPADARVKALLDGVTLADAAVWADCVKGVKPDAGYTYPAPGRYASCAPFETPARIAEMADYVRRNLRQCEPRAGQETCHQQYHYTNVALPRSRYIEGFAGTSGHDIVGAARAAIRVLQGEPSPAPMDFQSRREALFVLVHAIGDMHEPMHVGSVYLDARGQRVDPDKTGLDPASQTIGGNALHVAGTPASGPGSVNLHSVWDGVPEAFGPSHVNAAWVAEAARVPRDAGAPLDWPQLWASDTLMQARAAFDGMTFELKQGRRWTAQLPAGYEARADAIKRRQLTVGGARLAEVLKAVLGTR